MRHENSKQDYDESVEQAKGERTLSHKQQITFWIMKFTGALLLLAASSATAFQVGFPIPSALTHSAAKASSSLVVRTPLRSTVEDETEVASVDLSTAKADLLETAQDLKDEFGVLLIDSAAQEKLRQAVEKLESVSEAPSSVYELVGDWTLLCSTASASLENGPLDKINGIDTSKIPFFNEGPIKEIRNTLNKSLKVQQVIKSDEMTGAIDKVNHVLQYMPPDTLSAFLNDLPDALKSLNINPLQVSQSQVTLVHKAEVESTIPFIKTKLSLSSIVCKCLFPFSK